MRVNRLVAASVGVALIAFGAGGWFLQAPPDGQPSIYVQARLFETVMRHISDNYVEGTNPSELYQKAIRGLLGELGDPYAEFFTPKELAEFRIGTTGEYGGIGVRIGLADSWLTAVSILPGTPAERAGVRTGDRVIRIDGESTEGWSVDKAASRLRGPRGQPVTIEVAREAEAPPLSFRLVRDEIRVLAVPTAYFLEDGIGYADLNVVSENAAEELAAVLQRMQGEGLRGLVLDVRGNPGGILQEAVDLADIFLPPGHVVVETRGRMRSANQKYTTSDRENLDDLPVVVLVDSYTASAAEILAGALQDHDRALVLGERTFGKGLAQLLFPLDAGHALKLTTERWYTPIGRSIQRTGRDVRRTGESPAAATPILRSGDAEDPELGAGDTGAAVAGAPDEDEQDSAVYRTAGGRMIRGGGGVYPDVVMASTDTLSAADRALEQALRPYGSRFGDVLFHFVVEYGRRNPNLQPDFVVSPELLAGFYDALSAGGVAVERPVYDAAAETVGRALESQLAFVRWGDEGIRKRRNLADEQVRAATELLRRARTAASLFDIAAQPGA